MTLLYLHNTQSFYVSSLDFLNSYRIRVTLFYFRDEQSQTRIQTQDIASQIRGSLLVNKKVLFHLLFLTVVLFGYCFALHFVEQKTEAQKSLLTSMGATPSVSEKSGL